MCCNALSPIIGVVQFFGGVVTYAGYGDGLYKAWYVRNDRYEIVAMGIVFIDNTKTKMKTSDSE